MTSTIINKVFTKGKLTLGIKFPDEKSVYFTIVQGCNTSRLRVTPFSWTIQVRSIVKASRDHILKVN